MKKLLILMFLLAPALGGTGCSSNAAEPRPGEPEPAEEAGRTDPGAYLFAYFTGNGPGQEAIRFAVSPDGLRYRALNRNKAVLSSAAISSSGGVRDPHLLRGHQGESFYMAATDLHVNSMGWSNRAMVLMRSGDLLEWSSSVVNIPRTFPEFADVSRVWAPQTIYDSRSSRYMIYFSMLRPGAPDKIYYAYANEDFTGLATRPRLLFESPDGVPTIDGDIVRRNGRFHLFYKRGGTRSGIARAVADSLTGPYQVAARRVDRTAEPVEGSGTFRLNNSDTYILMYDLYTSGRYQFTQSTDLQTFSVIENGISMDFDPRHGSVLPLSMEEGERLIRRWGSPSIMVFLREGSE